ncbi:MAG: diacylglycerol kinase [Anaeromyxobacter sp.]
MTGPAPRPAGALAAFAASFGWAWSGLVEGALRDRNLRVHLASGVLAGAVAALAPLTPFERALLLLCVALVVALEAANTAVEHVVDLASPGPSEGARRAKDAAAGAVLAGASGAVLVALAILGSRPDEVVASILSAPAAATGAAVAALVAGLLPWKAGASRTRDVVLVGLGIAGFVALALGARSQAGVACAALCLGVSCAAAGRAR